MGLEHQYGILADGNLGLYSYGAAGVICTLLVAWAFITRRSHSLTTPLLVASALTAVWAGVVASATLLPPSPTTRLMYLAEIARNAAWCFLLLRVIGLRLQHSDHILASNRWIPWFAIGVAIIAAVLIAVPTQITVSPESSGQPSSLIFGVWLAVAIFGLLLLEQVLRNSNESERWSLKYLCLGLGIMFAYDFFMYAEALLFRQLDTNLWQARGIVISMAAVFVATGSSRMIRSGNTRSLYLSHHTAFHTVTLLAAGVYLIAMAVAGYFIRYLGGSWGGVLQIAFLSAAGLLLVALLLSGQIRARTRVWLSKNFYSYKFDYRIEWLQFTQTLSEGGSDVPINIIHAIANLAKSPGGILWSRADGDQFYVAARLDMPDPGPDNDLLGLPTWMQDCQWTIDLQEWRQSPDIYQNLELPEFLLDIPRAWLIIPLMLGSRLQGILLLRESDLQPKLNWEDRDLLKVAGRQAASNLAQYQANLALMESHQFDAFNRLSAYVIHDLKNILAQQSLIVMNAKKHRDNPAFFDDVIDTVDNSVERMTRLMEQMRSGERENSKQQLSLYTVLHEAVDSLQNRHPVPVLMANGHKLIIEADKDRLTTVFTHIIQNAQEATHIAGKVAVRLLHERGGAIVEVEDDGVGMDEEFLRNRLFKPFDSTKGLTGMGIGAFESREFARNLGGDIQVSSTPGEGSIFRIMLPCTEDHSEPETKEKEARSE